MIFFFIKETNLFMPGPSHHSSWDSNRGIRRGAGREETRNNRMEEDTREEEQDVVERGVTNTVNGTEENTCGQCGKTFKYRKVLTLFYFFIY
jgi:hypothetical protein